MAIYRTSLALALFAFSITSMAQSQQEVPQSGSENSSPEASKPSSPQPAAAGVVTLSTTVTGNQEQPKVLYIVPWQAAEDERILYEPLNSQTNRVFSHIERSEHLRELEFISELGGDLGK